MGHSADRWQWHDLLPGSRARAQQQPGSLVGRQLAGHRHITAVIAGAVAALVRKGSPRHIRAGRWYYQAITVVFGTATVLAAMR